MRLATHQNRTHGRVQDLGTLDARAEAWDDEGEEPAVVTDHGCLLAIVGRRIAPGHAWAWTGESPDPS